MYLLIIELMHKSNITQTIVLISRTTEHVSHGDILGKV